MPIDETNVLAALDAALLAPSAPESAANFREATKDRDDEPWSAAAKERLYRLAAIRPELHRDLVHYLFGAIAGEQEPEAIAFFLNLLPDSAHGSTAVDALDRVDPVRLAPALRAWLAAHGDAGVAEPMMVNALRAKTDLAVPPAAGAVPVDAELLEYWVQREDFPTLRAALAAGADPSTPLGYGDTMLHFAIDAWTSATDTSAFGASKPAWEGFIAALLEAGADPDRKLGGRFSGSQERNWPKGTSARKMVALARDDGGSEPEELDRLEALFPAPKKKAAGKKAAKG